MQWSWNTRATVASDLHSASTNWLFWNSMMGLPNALRCLTIDGERERALEHSLGVDHHDQALAEIVHELGEALALRCPAGFPAAA